MRNFVLFALMGLCLIITIGLVAHAQGTGKLCKDINDSIRGRGHYKCKTSQGFYVEYDKKGGDYPYTIKGMRLSRALGPVKNGTDNNDHFKSIKPGATDEVGQQIVGDDSPAIQLCKKLKPSGELLTEPKQEEFLDSFEHEMQSWLPKVGSSEKRQTPKLTKPGFEEMLKAIPDADKWTWSSSITPDSRSMEYALGISEEGGIDLGSRVYDGHNRDRFARCIKM